MTDHKHIRLPNYDYRTPGFYAATLVVENRDCCLAQIVGDQTILNPIGRIVKHSWQWLADQYAYVTLDEFVIMPNHIHGILQISDIGQIEDRLPLGKLLAAFKTHSTRQVRENRSIGRRFWQKDFYEHVVRNDEDLKSAREYIRNNPLKWHLDKENPENIKGFHP